MGAVYTVPELAVKLKCNIDMIRKKLREGELKGKRQKGEWLVTEESFLEYTQGIENPVPIKEFAKMVRKCEKCIRDKVISGEIKGVKLGKWYVDSEEIKKFIYTEEKDGEKDCSKGNEG